MPLRLAVIADSHFHAPTAAGQRPSQAAWASDASFNARNAVAVDLVNRSRPDLVVHLGDVPHPVPGLDEHEQALAVARQTYAALGAELLVVPGNHDVGDKPQPWAPAPSCDAAKHDRFRRWWGPAWWVREVQGVRLVGIDTPVLNTGLPLEDEQWAWLEALFVAAPGPRTLVFLHYPPFLLDPGEAEHYDNVAEPARGRLLALFERAGVEAVFCGHVHHPFWNQVRGIDYWLLPSTAFVRPAFSELSRVGPGDEFGRNDVDRLGFCVVDIEDDGPVRVSWIPTRGATEPDPIPRLGGEPGARRDCPLGLTLRHQWDAVQDVAVDGLDPFRRKWARNDLVLFGAWELGVRLLRVPFDDLRQPATRDRMMALGRHGFRFVPFAVGALSDADRALVAACRGVVRAVELVIPRVRLGEPLPELDVDRWVAPLGRRPSEARYFDHFVPHGFACDEVPPDGLGEGVVFRVVDPASEIPRIALRAGAVALVLVPRRAEGEIQADDEAVSERAVAAFQAARAHPDVPVVLDTTMDHDRGYFPRHALMDRRGNPRPAWHALQALATVKSP